MKLAMVIDRKKQTIEHKRSKTLSIILTMAMFNFE
jgi:hypothetical protein